MTNFELVEGVRARVNVSYEEAKKALEESGWDILAAVAKLEGQGKTKKNDFQGATAHQQGAAAAAYQQAPQSETNEETDSNKESYEETNSDEETSDEQGWQACENCSADDCDNCSQNTSEEKDNVKFTDFLKRVCQEKFTIKNDNDTFAKIPAVILPICLVFVFWPSVIVLALGGIFGLEYGFSGPTLDKTPLDKGAGKVNEFFKSIRDNIFNKKK